MSKTIATKIKTNKTENYKTPEILLPALRQYIRNDKSGFVFGFDYEETIKIVSSLQKKK